MTPLEEYGNLLNWFETEYTKKEQKFRRLTRMFNLHKIDTEEAKNAEKQLELLDEVAEEKRLRIKELEKLLGICEV